MQDENMLEQNKQIARRFYEECWNQGKVDRVDQLIAKDCRYHDPVFPSLAPGVDSLKRHITMSRNAFPDLRFSLDDMIAERDEVVVHWTAKRHPGRPISGRRGHPQDRHGWRHFHLPH
jgi:predicted ester cyclase